MQGTSTLRAAAGTPPAGAHGPSGGTHTTAQHEPFARLDTVVERLLGADLKLLYGMLGPMLVVCGVIFVLAVDPSAVWVALALVLEIGGLGLIVAKLLAMLSDEDDA